MVGGLMAMLFGGRGGSQEMSRSKLDALRARFCMVMDELRRTTSQLADRLDENYRWYHPAPGPLEASVGSVRMWERKPNGSDYVVRGGAGGRGHDGFVESHAAVFAEPTICADRYRARAGDRQGAARVHAATRRWPMGCPRWCR